MCRTEAAGGRGPVFCLTPNLVFASVLACALLLPSCPDVFCRAAQRINSPVLPSTAVVFKHFYYTYVSSSTCGRPNPRTYPVVFYLTAIVRMQLVFRKPHKKRRKEDEKPGGQRAQKQHPTSCCFHMSYFIPLLLLHGLAT